MTSTTTSPVTAAPSTASGAEAPDAPRVVRGIDRRSRWVLAACGGLLVVGGATAVVVHRADAVPAQVAAPVAAPVAADVHPGAISYGSEWPPRPVTPGQDVDGSRVRPTTPDGTAAAADTLGTGHGRALLTP